MSTHRRSLQVFSIIAILAMIFSNIQSPAVYAQRSDGVKRQFNAESGKVSFLGPESGRSLSASKALGTFLRPQDPAMALAERFGPEFGLKNPARNLSEMKIKQSEDGRLTVRYQQNHQGIPVMGGELIVNTNEDGDLFSMSGELSTELSLPTQPTIDSEQAREAALQAVAKWHEKNALDFVTSEPELWIYDEGLLQPSARPVELVWRMEVTPLDNNMPVRELVLVNAERGNISLHFNQVDSAWSASTHLPQSGTAIALPSSQHQYFDLAIDLTRGLVYGTDISGTVDVIDMNTTDVVTSYPLPAGANPKGIDLSPDGSELAIALNGLGKILFMNPATGATIAEVIPQLNGDPNLPFDVIYGRTGRLYSDGNPGSGGIDYVHIIDAATHTWVAKSPYPLVLRTGAELVLSADNKYLYANQTFSPNNIYIYDVQTDVVTKLYEGPHGPVSASKFTILPDGSKIFTSSGQVWNSTMQSQLGNLQGAPGNLIEYVPNQNMVVLSAAVAGGDVLKFIDATDYHLLATYNPSPSGVINEMEVAADGSKLVININNEIQVLNLNSTLPASVTAESGSNQSTLPETQFPQPLKARVGNYLGMPLAGINVTFTAPSSGASGIFADTNTNTSTSVTDVNGFATSSAITANNLKGSYTVHATVTGVSGSADFLIANGNVQFVKTYTANNATHLPGTFLCDQNAPGCTNGINLHADKAHVYAIGTSDLYYYQHNRKGIDENNLPIISTVHYYSGYANAFWDGEQMVYGDAYGFPLADDVVAHELTHGVTQYESNLFYYYQSGAINESFSDLWGEYYDQTNSQGNDTAGVQWLMGEDVSGLGALRSMSNPPSFGDPDKMSSTYYYEGADDNGGVHINSGLNNKAVFLLVDGGTFNGKTVIALGWDKTAAIYYEAQTNLLSSGADYSDLYYALQQACTNLIGQKGITSGNCTEVRDAVDAVEMNAQPVSNFNTDAPLCTVNTPVIVFADDLESGTANWTFNNGSYTRWQYDSPYGPYAQSGEHSLFADDYPQYPGNPTDARASLVSFVVPNNSYLHFAHAYDFERYGPENYDGGVLEYSMNGGSTWNDGGSLMQYNGYKGTIFSNYINPLKGRSAYVGSSHGYISTRVNLSSLAGQAVTFRWRMGLDDYVAALGWWVDNIKVYTCGPVTTFADVPLDYWAWNYVEGLYAAGVTSGCSTSPLLYCPATTVTRDQMAVFLLRAKHGSSYVPPAPTGVFEDVPTNYWATAWIEQLAAEGITGGCGSGSYCPEYPVTRDQMAVFLLRSKYGASYTPPAVGVGTGFGDVPADHWAAPWIKQLAAEGITGGCSVTPSLYCPATPVSRAQMAVFLVKTFNLP